MAGFKFRHGDLDKIDKLIKKYNKKIDKLKNENYNEDFIPSKLKYKNVVENIIKDNDFTRQNLKDEIQIMESFIKKNSEKMLKSSRGLSLPKFKKREIDIKVKAINRERAKLQKEYESTPLTDRNIILEMPEENRKNFNVSKIIPKTFKWKNMSRNDYKWYLKTLDEYRLEREYRDNEYRKHFYMALHATLLDEDYKRVTEILDTIPTNEIVKKYYTDLNMDIDFIYERSDYDNRIEAIIDSWNSVKQEGGY